MTDLKAKAIKIIEQIPDDRMSYVLRKLEGWEKEFPFQDKSREERKRRADEAWEEIHRIVAPYRDKFPKDVDYKEELQKYREERYGVA